MEAISRASSTSAAFFALASALAARSINTGRGVDPAICSMTPTPVAPVLAACTFNTVPILDHPLLFDPKTRPGLRQLPNPDDPSFSPCPTPTPLVGVGVRHGLPSSPNL